MHIRESDTPFDNPEHDEMLSNDADTWLCLYLKRSDLEMLGTNYANHTPVGRVTYVEATGA